MEYHKNYHPDGEETPVEIAPEPVDATLQEARLELLIKVKPLSNVKRPEQRIKDKATPSLEDIMSFMAFDD